MSDDKDENVNTMTFDVMPGADPVEEDDTPPIDLSFPDEPEPEAKEEEETVEETVAEESEEVVAEEETEEPAEDVEPEAESEEEPEALKEPEPEPEPEVEEKPAEPKSKKPMVPKSRLDEVLAKQKELQKQLEDMKAVQAAEDEAPEEYDFAAKEVEYQNALLDGEVEKATAIRTEIRKAERAQIEFEMTQKMSQTVSQNREATALQQAATELENAFPQFNKASDQFDESLTNEVVELRDAFIMKGENAVSALSKAARFVIREYDLVQNEEAPSLASTASAVDEVAKKRKEVSRKLKAADSQPPEMPGESSSAKGESQYDISNMTEEEFDALPEATLKRLRGDIL